MQLSRDAPLFELERPYFYPSGYSYQRLHAWVRLAQRNAFDVHGAVGIETYVATSSGRLRRWADATMLRDGEWHELVVSLVNDRAIGGIGISLWMYASPVTWDVPELDLFVDDVWLE